MALKSRASPNRNPEYYLRDTKPLGGISGLRKTEPRTQRSSTNRNEEEVVIPRLSALSRNRFSSAKTAFHCINSRVDRLRIRADCDLTLGWCVSQEPLSTEVNNCPLVTENSPLYTNECNLTHGDQTVTALSGRHEPHPTRSSSSSSSSLPETVCQMESLRTDSLWRTGEACH